MGQRRDCSLVNGLTTDGGGGSGKSYLLQTLIEMLRHQGKNVLVLALTGVAAMIIGGQTVHSALQI